MACRQSASWDLYHLASSPESFRRLRGNPGGEGPWSRGALVSFRDESWGVCVCVELRSFLLWVGLW